jgi:hypothetical protein
MKNMYIPLGHLSIAWAKRENSVHRCRIQCDRIGLVYIVYIHYKNAIQACTTSMPPTCSTSAAPAAARNICFCCCCTRNSTQQHYCDNLRSYCCCCSCCHYSSCCCYSYWPSYPASRKSWCACCARRAVICKDIQVPARDAETPAVAWNPYAR